MTFNYGIDHLTVDKVLDIASGKLKAIVNSDAIAKVNACRAKVEKMANSNKAVYGINTGFGSLCNTQISHDELTQLQENLLLSHACGTGDYVPREVIKLMLLLHGSRELL
jgi:histidine ammonia-lyase